MTLQDLLNILQNPDRLRIIKGDKDLYIGYLANIKHNENGLTGKEEVERFRVIPELRHKQWKEKDLMPPLEPELLAKYQFSDLEMKIYYTIYLK